jgi:hypothetical protein
MVRSREKSLFLHHRKGVSDSLAKKMHLHEGLAEQLAVAHREVAELAPTSRELADLRVREADAREDAREAE